MLTKFEVTNFKNFEGKLVFDLKKSNMYEFNKECVENGIINKALIYGHNGVGKSNLGFAIFDLVSHLTDRELDSANYRHYLNAACDCDMASFVYEFEFSEGNVRYEYGKKDLGSLVYEKLYINNQEYASINRAESTVAKIKASGAENLKLDMGTSKISVISYIHNNTVLTDNRDNNCFFSFVRFVNGMLFFRSLEKNNYIGFEQGSTYICADIVENGDVQDFEQFLKGAGIDCKIVAVEGKERPDLALDFAGNYIPFYQVASHGTMSLTLFYYWYRKFRRESTVSFLFIDEFDSYYHHSLSAFIIERLKEVPAQTIVTTHNTSIMTNELLRPDCYFLLNKEGLKSLANRTAKDLREAHNIEKMYKSGAFGE